MAETRQTTSTFLELVSGHLDGRTPLCMPLHQELGAQQAGKGLVFKGEEPRRDHPPSYLSDSDGAPRNWEQSPRGYKNPFSPIISFEIMNRLYVKSG